MEEYPSYLDSPDSALTSFLGDAEALTYHLIDGTDIRIELSPNFIKSIPISQFSSYDYYTLVK